MRSDTESALTVKSLTDECYETLKGILTRCEIEPGDRFTEKSLIEQTGFGRTPVREALARLTYDGLVETLPRSGYRATEVDSRTASDLIDIWRLIGPLVARRGSERLTPPLLEELKTHAESLARENSSPQESIDAADKVFRLLARASGSQDLMFLIDRLSGKLRRLYTLFLNTPAGHEWSATENRRWGDSSWLHDPEVAAATVSLAIATWQTGLTQIIGEGADSDRHGS